MSSPARGVHPLLLASLEACEVLLNDQPVKLSQLKTRDVVQLAIKPWLQRTQHGSYWEALQNGALVLPHHPLDKDHAAGSHYVRVDGPDVSYVCWKDVRPSGSSGPTQLCTMPALVEASHDPILPSAPQFADGAPVIHYVVHAWDGKFGDLVQSVMTHYNTRMWGSMSLEAAAQYKTVSYLAHKRDEWFCSYQVPVYYWLDILALDQLDCTPSRPPVDVMVSDMMLACQSVLLCAAPSLKAPLFTSRLWCMYELLVATELRMRLNFIAPSLEAYKHDCLHTSAQSLTQLYGAAWLDLDPGRAETCVPADRDLLVHLINTGIQSDDFLGSFAMPSRLQVVKARLRAALADMLLWSHLLGKYSAAAVARCHEAADEAAHRAATQSSTNTELYLQALHSMEAAQSRGSPMRARHPSSGRPAPAPTSHSRRQSLEAAVPKSSDFAPRFPDLLLQCSRASSTTGVPETLPSPCSANSASLPGLPSLRQTPASSKTQPTATAVPLPRACPDHPGMKEVLATKVFIDLAGHADDDVTQLIVEARLADPATAWVPIKCTCHCASCTELLHHTAAQQQQHHAARPGRHSSAQQVPAHGTMTPSAAASHRTLIDVYPTYQRSAATGRLTCTSSGHPVITLPRPPRSNPLHAHDTPDCMGRASKYPGTSQLHAPSPSGGRRSGSLPTSAAGSPRSSFSGLQAPGLDLLTKRMHQTGVAIGVQPGQRTRMSNPGSMVLPGFDKPAVSFTRSSHTTTMDVVCDDSDMTVSSRFARHHAAQPDKGKSRSSTSLHPTRLPARFEDMVSSSGVVTATDLEHRVGAAETWQHVEAVAWQHRQSRDLDALSEPWLAQCSSRPLSRAGAAAPVVSPGGLRAANALALALPTLVVPGGRATHMHAAGDLAPTSAEAPPARISQGFDTVSVSQDLALAGARVYKREAVQQSLKTEHHRTALP